MHSVQKRGSYNKDYRNTLTVVLSDTTGLTDADTNTIDLPRRMESFSMSWNKIGNFNHLTCYLTDNFSNINSNHRSLSVFNNF